MLMINATLEIALTVFATLMLIAQLAAIKFKIPYTLILVFIGIAITAISAVAVATGPVSTVLLNAIASIKSIYNQLVTSGLFVGLIVPPLIFEAMIHIKRDQLRAVIRPSLALATFGVLISTIITAIAVWKFAGIPIYIALLFATIVSPTDTITVLQIFKRVKVPARLSTLMDMEASFNDATAIVLFSIILSSNGIGHSLILHGIGVFLYNFIGGIVIGILIARAAKWIHVRINDKLAEIVLTIVAVYGSYVLASGLGMSGLIAVVIVGLYFGNETMKVALSKSVKTSIASFWEIAAFVGNSIAFLLIGFVTNFSTIFQAAALIFIAYLATLLARALTVYPMFALFNGPRRKLPFNWSNVAILGGVRGALSIALVATLAASAAISSAALTTVTTMVFGVVFISIIVQVPALSKYAGGMFGTHRRAVEI